MTLLLNRMAIALLTTVMFGITSNALGAQQQDRSTVNAQAKRPTRFSRAWRLRVNLKTPVMVTLRAENAPLEEIMVDVQKQLGVPVILSSLMKTQRVTLELNDLPLETALRILAPQPYIDYALSGDPTLPPRYVAIYLNAMNEPLPSTSGGDVGIKETFLIEGNTEDADPPVVGNENPPLYVSFEKGKLAVRARKQPLFIVLSEIADKVGIPFDSTYQSNQVVDVEFTDYALEDAVRRLAPNVRLYVRTDLLTLETKPLRIDVVAPTQAGR